MIILQNVSKVFGMGNAGLSDVTLTIEPGEFIFLVGHTGSGKTTLLKLLLRQMLPTQGSISVADIDLVKLSKRKIPHYRKKIGVVFQDLKLLMDRTIGENVLLPLEINGTKRHHALKRVEELLMQVGLIDHKDKFPVQLSGGELQRVAIARALTLSPAVLLADEPTGNLDTKTAFEIVELLHEINKLGTTIIMATHNLDILKKYPKNRVVALEKGKLLSDQNQKATKASDPAFQQITGFTVVAQQEKKENNKEEKK
jgi:cell division transport system ATP-binding protein